MYLIMIKKDDTLNTTLKNVTMDFQLSVKDCNVSETIESAISVTIGV